MKKKMRHALKKEFLQNKMKKSVMCLRAMKADPGEHEACSWEGVMTMLSDVMKHGSSDEKAAAVMSTISWLKAHDWIEMHDHLDKMEKLLSEAMKPEDAESEDEAEVDGDEQLTPPEASTSRKAETVAAIMK